MIPKGQGQEGSRLVTGAPPKTPDGETKAVEPTVPPHKLQGGGGNAPLYAQSSGNPNSPRNKTCQRSRVYPAPTQGGSRRGSRSFLPARLCPGRATAATGTVGEGPCTAVALQDVQSWQIPPLFPFPGKHVSWTFLEERDHTLENPLLSIKSSFK